MVLLSDLIVFDEYFRFDRPQVAQGEDYVAAAVKDSPEEFVATGQKVTTDVAPFRTEEFVAAGNNNYEAVE